jgi:hypothetical protein
MVEITMNTPGPSVRLRSCGACDRVEWFVGDRPTDRDGALGQLATTGRR